MSSSFLHPSSSQHHLFLASAHSSLILLFLLFFLASKPPCHSPNTSTTTTLFNILASLSACLALAYFSLAFCLLQSAAAAAAAPIHSCLVLVVQGITWLILSFTVAFTAPQRPLPTFIRVWWVLAFLLGTFSLVSCVIDLINDEALSAERALVLAQWPICCMILVCAFQKGPSYKSSTSLLEPLLNEDLPKDNSHIKSFVPVINTNVTPFATAGFFSRMSFSWINPLLSLGYKRPLQQAEVPSLGQADQAETTYDAFSRAWKRQRLRDPSKDPSVFWALALCNWQEIMINGLYALFKTLMLSAGPLVLNSFIRYARGEHLFKFEGYVLVSALFFAKLLESASEKQWYFGSRRIGIHIRSALIGAIYQKQLRLSSAGRQRHSTGEIINYVSVDAYRIGEFPYWMHKLWTTPFQVVVALAILFYSVGWATVAGMLAMLLTMLVNSPLAKLQQRFQSELMQAQGKRLRATTEALQSMKVLKLQAWEDHFKSSIEAIRAIEYKWLSALQYRKTMNTLVYWISPVLVLTVTFATSYFLGVPLTPTNLFTSLATLRLVQEPIRVVPDLITAVIQARVSLARVAKFLLDDELQPDAVDWETQRISDHAVRIEDASLSWNPLSSRPTLSNINLQVRRGQRIAVCGEVGSGKSTLLYSILGEVPKLSGTLEVSGSVAYVAQTAWIQSGTVRDNVLFGLSMDKKRYKETLQACALDKDLESFPFGDLTEIGERGVNMSGGQKQRIQLARAVYQDSDTYLLDDPFSAVDAQTATSLFKDCVMGSLSNKTVILVTHQVEFLPAFDSILLMRAGEIHQAGRYVELLEPGSGFEELVSAHLETMKANGAEGRVDEFCGTSTLPIDDSEVEKQVNKVKSQEGEAAICEQLTKKEERETGDTGMKPYRDYLSQKKVCCFYFSMAVLSQLLFVIGQVYSNTWLAAKVDDPHIGTALLLIVYSAVGFASTLFLCVRSIFVVIMGLAASGSFFSVLMSSLFRAPMAFFDSTPTGRILTRVSSDLSILDNEFPFTLLFSVSSILNTLSNLAVMAVVTWQTILVILPTIYFSWRLQRYYFATAKELMRINGTTKSPVANFLGESISGASTIRAFKVEGNFLQHYLSIIDDNSSPFLHTFAVNQWIIQRLEVLSAAVLCSSALVMTLLPAGSIDPGYVGLALSYGLTLNVSLVNSVQNQCVLANYSVSVERMKQYMHIRSEAPVVIEGRRPGSSWPSKGRVELQNLQVRYQPQLPLVLKGITCIFEGGEKVGVVGRTGSGKTTLISALFRLVEPAGGRIFIDELDITSVGLHDLRCRLSIIPQEATLFRGTVRFNLDPLSLYPDTKIWEVLDKCQLGSAIREKPDKLDAPVGDDGTNWSVGQRQLFCLGRALLKSSRILVLDEASASIDNATDWILQRTIREEFGSCTVITVAHRIPTVMDSDKVLALSDGEVVEFDEPRKLMEERSSLFGKLVREYWGGSEKARTIR